MTGTAERGHVNQAQGSKGVRGPTLRDLDFFLSSPFASLVFSLSRPFPRTPPHMSTPDKEVGGVYSLARVFFNAVTKSSEDSEDILPQEVGPFH